MTDIALDTEINVKEKIKEIIKEPERYKVLFLNDDHTPMDFVVSLLVEVFRHSEKTACLLYTSPSPRDATLSRMPSSA